MRREPRPAALPDAVAVAAVAVGDQAAFGALYDRYARSVFSLALRITHDRELAEEIAQDVFLRLWCHAASYTAARSRVGTWLLSITHHRAIDVVRRRGRWPDAASTDDDRVQDLPDWRADVEESAWVRVRRGRVQRALAHLPTAQRQVIELAYFAGLTQVEIAARLGVPVGTVKTRLRLGLLKLRDLVPAQAMGVAPVGASGQRRGESEP